MKKLILLTLLVTTITTAQEKISVLAAQDMRLLLNGSETYPSGTFNMIYRVQLEAKQDKLGFASVFTEFEVGSLSPHYKRYSLNLKYTLNQMIKGFESSAYVGYGIIDRGFSKSSFGFGGSLAYKIGEKMKVNAILQIVDRMDLGALYNDRKLKGSFFLGLSYEIFKTKGR